MLTWYQAQAKVDEFMCGIDERVTEECSKRKVRYLHRFWGCGSCVDSGGFAAAFAITCAAAASVAAAVLALVKVSWRLLSMC